MRKRAEWRSVGGKGKPYPDWLRALQGKHGAYAIRRPASSITDSPRVLYVGESHTGNLYGTLTRHLQSWNRDRPSFGFDSSARQHDPGTIYNRASVEVAVWPTSTGAAAIRMQARLIATLSPRDNILEVPF